MKFQVKIIKNNTGKRMTIARLRNLGAETARGKILTFLDADMVVPEDWLENAKKHYDAGFKGALGFVNKVPDDAGYVARAWGDRLYIKRDHIMDVDFIPGRNIFVNHSVFGEINGFDSNLITGEDKDLTLRIVAKGYRVVSSPESPVIHLGFEKNIVEFIKKEFWRQGSTIKLTKKLGLSIRTLRHPLLCIFHLVMPIMIIVFIIEKKLGFLGIILLLWLLPSIMLTLRDIGFKWAKGMLPAIVFLTLVRWNVASIALIQQLLSIKK